MNKVFLVMGCMLLCGASYSQSGIRSKHIDPFTVGKPSFTVAKQTFVSPNYGQAIPRNFYTQHFGFFCRQELKMQQAHVPVTFRLGSMEYCNYLEEKTGCR